MERNFLDFLDENMEHKKLDELNLKPFGFWNVSSKNEKMGDIAQW